MLVKLMNWTSKPENRYLHFINFPKIKWFPTFNRHRNDREPSKNMYKLDILQRLFNTLEIYIQLYTMR